MYLARRLVRLDSEKANGNIMNYIFDIHQKSTILESQPSFIPLKGKSGTGQKLYLQYLTSSTNNKSSNLGTIIDNTPILHVSISTPFSAASFYKKIIAKLNNTPQNVNKPLMQLVSYCHILLKSRQVEMLIIDDFDLMQSERDKSLALDLINKLSLDLNIAIVLVGEKFDEGDEVI